MLAINMATRPSVARALQRNKSSALPSGTNARLVVARNDAQKTETEVTPASAEASSSAASTSGSRLQTPEKEGFVKGQGTAIVTGAISIIFGVAYLALVSLLDVRGGELQPPPPEAFLN